MGVHNCSVNQSSQQWIHSPPLFTGFHVELTVSCGSTADCQKMHWQDTWSAAMKSCACPLRSTTHDTRGLSLALPPPFPRKPGPCLLLWAAVCPPASGHTHRVSTLCPTCLPRPSLPPPSPHSPSSPTPPLRMPPHPPLNWSCGRRQAALCLALHAAFFVVVPAAAGGPHIQHVGLPHTSPVLFGWIRCLCQHMLYHVCLHVVPPPSLPPLISCLQASCAVPCMRPCCCGSRQPQQGPSWPY